MRNYQYTLITGIITLLIVSLVLVPGCLSRQPADNSSPGLQVSTKTSTGLPVTGTVGPVFNNTKDSIVNSQNITPTKKLGLVVYSADLYHTLPEWDNTAGTSIAIINVSITNNLATDYRLERDCIVIKSEGDTALEHGGDRVSGEMASMYLRFPLKFNPNETKKGLIVYIVYTGKKINDLILTDGSGKLIEKVDLNKIYNYR
jgi:hypothetical protein